MENTGKLKLEELRIQGLVDVFLNRRTVAPTASPSHLDEDSLAAFVEGSLSEKESTPIVSHLVDCSFCRHVTAELVKLDIAMADEPVRAIVTESQPSKISEVLSGLLARVFGTGDGAVFAHNEEEEKDDEKKENEE